MVGGVIAESLFHLLLFRLLLFRISLCRLFLFRLSLFRLSLSRLRLFPYRSLSLPPSSPSSAVVVGASVCAAVSHHEQVV